MSRDQGCVGTGHSTRTGTEPKQQSTEPERNSQRTGTYRSRNTALLGMEHVKEPSYRLAPNIDSIHI